MGKSVEELEKELEIARAEYREAFNNTPTGMNFSEYYKYMEPYSSKVEKLSRKVRLIKTPTYDELPEYGDVMSLKDFISAVKCGGFIDADGYGNYVKDGKMSDINIYPSDVLYKSIRKDFTKIIWFNK